MPAFQSIGSNPLAGLSENYVSGSPSRGAGSLIYSHIDRASRVNSRHWLYPSIAQFIVPKYDAEFGRKHPGYWPDANSGYAYSYDTDIIGGAGHHSSAAKVVEIADSMLHAINITRKYTILVYGIFPSTSETNVILSTGSYDTGFGLLHNNVDGFIVEIGELFNMVTTTSSGWVAKPNYPELVGLVSGIDGTLPKLYYNGRIDYNSSGFIPQTSADTFMRLGMDELGDLPSQYTNWQHIYTLLIDRTLSFSELNELNANPMAMFESRNIQIPVSWNPDPGVQNASIAYGPYPAVQRPPVIKTSKSLATSQSTADILDFEHPISKDLIQALNYAYPRQDFCGNSTYYTMTTPLTQRGSVAGMCGYSDINDQWACDTYRLTKDTGGDITILFIWLLVDVVQIIKNPVWRANSNGSATLAWATGNVQDTNYLQAYIWNTASTGFGNTHQNLLNASSPNLVVMRISEGGYLLDLWLNGIKSINPATLTGTTNVPQLKTADNPLSVGNRYPSFGARPAGGIPLVYHWNRALTDKEIESLNVNPWQLFARKTTQPFPGPRRKLI